MRAEDRILEAMVGETEEDRYYQEEQMKEEYFEYLDALQELGTINRYGARRYLMEEFGLSKREAGDVLSEWMRTLDLDVGLAAP